MLRPRSMIDRLTDRLVEEVDASSLVFLRVMFGLILLVEVWRFVAYGWIARYYIDPTFHFTYYGFEWVTPWPGTGMYWHFALLAVLSVGICVGALYRLASALFVLAFGYVFLLDQARYLNHFYFVLLLGFLLAVVPAHRTWSVDAALRPALRRDTVPAWAVWLFRLQFEIVYIYAGLVKVTPDWLRLEPLGMWLAEHRDWPVVGPLLLEDGVVAAAAYGSILLHLVGAPLLLHPRARGYVIGLYTLFHVMNHVLFQIGIFPWLCLAGTMIFLEPDWPRRAWAWTQGRMTGWRWPARGTAHG